MRKIIIKVVLLTLFCSVVCNGQLVKLGIKAGGNYSNFASSQLQTKVLTSYHAGLIAEIGLGKSLVLQPEVLYSTQGASYENVLEEVRAELGYVSIPILLRIKLGQTLSLDFGPQFSFLASKKVDFTTDVNDLDFGAAGGLTINLTEQLFVQGRYVAGLTEIGKNADIKNAVGQLSLGIKF